MDDPAVGARLAVVRIELRGLLEVLVGLEQRGVHVLAGRLGVDAGEAAVDLERDLGVARADQRDQAAGQERLVVGRVERDRDVALVLGRLELVLAQEVLGDVEALAALLGRALIVEGAAREQRKQ